MAKTVRDMGNEGYPLTDILKALGISRSTHGRWLDKLPSYAAAIQAWEVNAKQFYSAVDERRRKFVGQGASRFYTPEYAAQIYELTDFEMCEAQLAAMFSVAKSTLQRWAKDYEEFAEALDWYCTQAEALFMKQGMDLARSPSRLSQPKLYTFQMANRFNMTEKIDVSHNNGKGEALVPPKVTINAVSAKPSKAD